MSHEGHVFEEGHAKSEYEDPLLGRKPIELVPYFPGL
jgi:hypothetical protein